MALAGLETTTGTKIAIAVGEATDPTVQGVGGWGDLTFDQIVGVVTFGEWGNQEEDVSEPTLAEGQVIHQNGVADGGEVPINIQYRDTDAGRVKVEANGGTQQIVSIRKTYKSGDTEYASGVLTSPRQREASGGAIRGFTVNLRVNTKVYPFAAA